MLQTKLLLRGTYCAFRHSYVSNYRLIGTVICSPKKVETNYITNRLYSVSHDDAKKVQPNDFEKHVIYFGVLESKIKGLKVVSYSTSLLTIIAQAFMYDKLMSLGTPAMTALCACLGFFTFVTPFFIYLVTKKYIIEIKYDPQNDTYESRTLKFLLGNQIVNFKIDDIKMNESPSLFSTFSIKGKPVILYEEGFLNKEHYIRIMGYDKPIDLGTISPDCSTESDSQNKQM